MLRPPCLRPLLPPPPSSSGSSSVPPGTVKPEPLSSASPSTNTALRTANTAPSTMRFWEAASRWRSQEDRIPTVGLFPSDWQGLSCGVLNRWRRIRQVSLAPGSESCSLQANKHKPINKDSRSEKEPNRTAHVYVGRKNTLKYK